MKHKIRVSAIQRLCLQDGPGVRTTVFLKGCYLACPWCCNPETIYYNDSLLFCKNSTLCGNSSLCKSCEVFHGNRKRADCPLGAYSKTFKDYEVQELYTLLLRDKSLYEQGGGITFSGGEPLMQAEQLLPLLSLLHAAGIHIAVESSLYAPRLNFEKITPLIDYWLVDVKFQFGFISYLEKNKYLCDFVENLSEIQHYTSAQYVIRMVISQQAILQKEAILERLLKYGIKEIELLPCHQLAENKYKQLGYNPPVYCAPKKKDLDAFIILLESNGLNVNVLKL